MSRESDGGPFGHEERGASRAVTAIEVAIILLAVAIGVVLRMGGQMAIIESGSMEPALFANDRVMLDKRKQTIAQLKRGDIIIFQWDPSERDATYVKRIIGLPGETVFIFRGQVFVNGLPLNEPYLREPGQRERPVRVVVGPDEFFVLGDNRNNSEDSREKGSVPRANVLGRITRVLWPRAHAGSVR